jgi:uncharacterized delta-60 repeat protein
VSDDDFALVRVNPDGRLDESFGAGGLVTYDLAANDRVKDLLVQPDGKVLLVGYSGVDDVNSHLPAQAQVTLLRFNTNGSLDASFNADPLPADQNSVRVANAIALQDDGRIVVAGSVRNAGGEDMFVARYLSGLVIPPPPPAPDFSLTAEPATVTGARGSKVRFTITINRVGGFTGPVGIEFDFDPRLRVTSLDPSADGQMFTYTVKIKGKMPAGTYPIFFSGTDLNGRRRTVTVTLVIT